MSHLAAQYEVNITVTAIATGGPPAVSPNFKGEQRLVNMSSFVPTSFSLVPLLLLLHLPPPPRLLPLGHLSLILRDVPVRVR